MSAPAQEPAGGVFGVLPVKDLDDAKQRLEPALSAPERRGLFRAMLEDVLAALCGARGLAGVVVVTRHVEVERLARRYGARVLGEPANDGHTAAVTRAARALAADGSGGMIAVPGDVPLATTAEIEAVLAAHRPAPAVTIAPARDRLGSNAVLCSPPDCLPLRFGDDSFFPHLEKARTLGIEPTVVPQPGLGLDVDTPADLDAFLATPSPTRAYRFLERAGVVARRRGG